MDNSRGLDDRFDAGIEPDAGGVDDGALEIGNDERRMHVRAYNHWVSLLRGRAYPSIEDLDPENIVDFGPKSVLLDFSAGIENPRIAFLGKQLREECAVGAEITHVAEVPSRSLLSRLTDHYLQIIANRAPIGFEAEFLGLRGHATLYRGILMPFSSDTDSIDYIYGVINWKEMVDAETQAQLNAEVAEARRTAPAAPVLGAPIWADGPSGGFGEADSPVVETDDAGDAEPAAAPHALAETLPDRLLLARESAAAARASDTRSRAALYRALSRAHDFAVAAAGDPEGLADLLDDAGIKAQARAPMTPIVKLVFGADYDKTRLTEFAAVLAHAAHHGVGEGELETFVAGHAGGIKGIVAAERARHRPVRTPLGIDAAATELRGRAALASLALAAGDAEFVVLLARSNAEGLLDVIGRIDGDRALAERAMRRVVG